MSDREEVAGAEETQADMEVHYVDVKVDVVEVGVDEVGNMTKRAQVRIYSDGKYYYREGVWVKCWTYVHYLVGFVMQQKQHQRSLGRSSYYWQVDEWDKRDIGLHSDACVSAMVAVMVVRNFEGGSWELEEGKL